jgi:dephospho-CoA kinase
MNDRTETLLVAITGGIGSGKTTFAKLVEADGYPVIFTDDVAKHLLNDNAELKMKIVSAFGDGAYSNGKYNASYVSGIVFNDSNNLQKLNQMVHPLVIEQMIDRIELLQDSDASIIFVESALIFELGLESGFDYVLSVNANESVRIQRIMERSNLTEDEIKKRMASQLSQEVKNKSADFIVENNGSIAELNKAKDFIMSVLSILPNRIFEES